MSSKKVVQCLVIAGFLTIIAPAINVHAKEPVRNPTNPSEIVEPLEPAGARDAPAEAEVTKSSAEEVERPKKKAKPSSKKPKQKHARRFLDELFSAEQTSILNSNDDGAGGGDAPNEQKGYWADIAYRLAGKVLLAR
ncbi:MAG: hypothetical protein LKJ03_09325 [Enterococcaceae bacterium]|jgi:hypothetical protein|nr:hypothetical protein [Enterococcaceae bacterium]